MLQTIDPTLKITEPRLYLCKPDRTAISILSEAFGITNNVKLGGINELNFTLPTKVEIRHILFDNPNLLRLKDRYLIKYSYDNKIEWYIINEITASMKTDTDGVDVHCFSLAYQLSDKILRGYNTDILYDFVPLNCSAILQDILSGTVWDASPLTIDADFDLMYRSLDIAEATVLDAVNQVATTFGALIEWDTENCLIYFKHLSEDGIDRGMHFDYGILLQSAESKSISDQMCTVFRIFGKDGISIQTVNPTGQDNITDFSYFMNTDYMSQSLIDAITAYDALILSRTGELNGYLVEKAGYQSSMDILVAAMSILVAEMAVINQNLDLAQTNRTSTTEILLAKAAKQIEIDNKQEEINSKQAEIDGISASITSLQTDLSIENNFTEAQIIERNMFIIEKIWSDENYSEPQDLYNEALARFENIRIPQLIATIDIVNFLEIITEQRNWDKLNVGDYCSIYHEKLNINISAKIIEMQFDFEAGTIKLVIANVKDIKNNESAFLESLYKATSSSTAFDMERSKYNSAYTDVNSVQSILNAAWDAALREINAGVNESVEIGSRGITLYNSDDPNRAIRMTHGVIGITDDGFNTLGVAIDSTGVYAERLVGQIIAGVNLYITNEAGNFYVDEMGVTIEDMDLTITKTDKSAKILLNVIDGITIQKNIGTFETPNWEDTFTVDSEGILTANDLIANRLIMKEGGDILIDGSTRTINFGNFTVIAGTINAENINLKGISVFNDDDPALETFSIGTDGNLSITGDITMTSGSISWSNVTPPTAEQVGAYGTEDEIYTYIDATGVYTGTIGCDKLTSAGIDPIIHLFTGKTGVTGDPALDATGNLEQGVGTQIRLKWNDTTYLSVADEHIHFYFEDLENPGTSNVYYTFTSTGWTGPAGTGGGVVEGVPVVVSSAIYVQNEEPVGVVNNSVWIDTDNYARYDLSTLTIDTVLSIVDNELISASGNITITLHEATMAGVIKKINNIGTGVITIEGNINNETNMYLFPGEGIELITNGSYWNY